MGAGATSAWSAGSSITAGTGNDQGESFNNRSTSAGDHSAAFREVTCAHWSAAHTRMAALNQTIKSRSNKLADCFVILY